MSKLAYYLGAGMHVGGQGSHQPLPLGGFGRNGSPPGLCYLFRKLNRGSLGIPEPSAVLCTKQRPNVAWMSKKTQERRENLALPREFTRSWGYRWEEGGDRQQLSVGGSVREWTHVREEGATVKQRCDCGCHGNSAFCYLIYTWSSDRRTRCRKFLWPDQPQTEVSASEVISWPCGLLNLPLSCKSSSHMWAERRDTGFLHIRAHISS